MHFMCCVRKTIWCIHVWMLDWRKSCIQNGVIEWFMTRCRWAGGNQVNQCAGELWKQVLPMTLMTCQTTSRNTSLSFLVYFMMQEPYFTLVCSPCASSPTAWGQMRPSSVTFLQREGLVFLFFFTGLNVKTWRSDVPSMQEQSQSPGGDYPLLLSQVDEWLVRLFTGGEFGHYEQAVFFLHLKHEMFNNVHMDFQPINESSVGAIK